MSAICPVAFGIKTSFVARANTFGHFTSSSVYCQSEGKFEDIEESVQETP